MAKLCCGWSSVWLHKRNETQRRRKQNKTKQPDIYPWSKVVCFVFVMLISPKPPRCFMPHSWYLGKALDEYGCIDLVWDCFEAMVWKLLIIEPFFQRKLNKIKTENFIGILGLFLSLLESPRWVRFDQVYFTIFRVKVWEILIFDRILLLEIQTDCQNGV